MTSMKIWITLALALSLVSCGPGSPCDRSSPCPNDPKTSDADKQSCRNNLNANMNSPCYSESVSLLNCWLDQTVCGSDGKTDGLNTLTKISNNCSKQSSAQATCCQNNASASACQ